MYNDKSASSIILPSIQQNQVVSLDRRGLATPQIGDYTSETGRSSSFLDNLLNQNSEAKRPNHNRSMIDLE